MKFSINDFSCKCDQIRSFQKFPADLVTFTREILNGELYFLCIDKYFATSWSFIYMVSELEKYVYIRKL